MFIAIDIGGTNMRIALVDLSGKENIIRLESHRVPKDYANGIELLSRHVEYLSMGQKIEGIGACFPGIIDEDEMIAKANNLIDWEMKPIKDTLQKRFNVPVKLVHDAKGAAVGEALFGAGKGSDRFVYFIWGTGVGACDVKKIDETHYFMFSFENGHHFMEWDGKQCNCGQKGCPEIYLGGDMLSEYFGSDMSFISDDDPRWDFIIQKASQVVLNTLVFHPVDLFVFSGGVINQRPFLLERIRLVMQQRLKMFPVPEMVLAEKADQSALFGCAGLFFIDLI